MDAYGFMKKIIFIQGIHNDGLMDRLMLESLEGMGFEVVYFPLFYTLYEPEKQRWLIEQINDFLGGIEERVIVLGHSFGGILTYSLRDDLYVKIEKIVTVASPHRVRLGWFKEILAKLPYKKDVKVDEQISYGLLFDKTVPFIFTKYHQSDRHHILPATHNEVLTTRSLIRKLL